MSNKEIAELIEFVAERAFALGISYTEALDEVERAAVVRRHKALVADVTSGLELYISEISAGEVNMDMLWSLRAALEVIEDDGHTAADDQAVRILRDAIAKATGGEE